MDFHAARRLFEASAAGAPPPLPSAFTHTVRSTSTRSPASPDPSHLSQDVFSQSVANQSPSSRTPKRAPSSPGLASSPAPASASTSAAAPSGSTATSVMSKSPSQPPVRLPPSTSRNSSSDYSDVGDYAADTEFYVPGVNDGDASTSLTELPSASAKSEFNAGSRRFSLVTSARVLPPNSGPPPRRTVSTSHASRVSTGPELHISSDVVSSDRPSNSLNAARATSPAENMSLTQNPDITAFEPADPSSLESANHDQPVTEPPDLSQSAPHHDNLYADALRGQLGDHQDSANNASPMKVGSSKDFDNDGESGLVNPPDLSFDSLGDDSDSFDGEGDEGLDGEEAPNGGVVRQHSNFSRLSAQSWLTVDSAQDVQVADNEEGSEGLDESSFEPKVAQRESETAQSPLKLPAVDTPMLFNRKYSAVDDHDPATLFNVDPYGGVMDAIQHKAVPDLSVFECCALLQAGVAAYKKKSFRRYGVRRVWLSPECDHLYWTSKKNGVFTDHVKLQKVAKMRCAEREVCIDIIEGYRISLIFANADEAGMWVRALSCLIPLQARVRETRGIIPAEKEREDYNLSDDVFNGVPLREYMSVNSYVVLCCAKGQPLSLGNKLAFSRSDGLFCGLRYIPQKIVPLMLRSQEEIAVLKRLSHPNVVKYHECLLDTEHGGNYVVFEHLARGSLIDASKLEGVRPIQEKAARELIRDVVNALEYLHTLRIAHGDVRPDNLLRAVNGSVKLNPLGCITHDFTEIKNVPALVKARLGDASPAFLAPELCWLSDPPEAHSKSYAMDVWAVGAVLYFMLYGRVPFGGSNDREIQENICKGKLRFPRQPETSKKVRNLLKALLSEKDPKTRIALSELKTHPWFLESEQTALHGSSGRGSESTRLIVSPAEVDSAIQVAKVRVAKKRGT